MFPPIWHEVVGRRCPYSQAWLTGFRREAMLGGPYPAILPDPQAVPLEGVLYSGIRRLDLKRLDLYEGHLYQRQTVRVRLLDQGECEAQAYVLKPRWRRLASGRDWDPRLFKPGKSAKLG